MAKSKVKIEGNNEKMLDSLFNQCSNNNQICYHLKKNPTLFTYLKSKVGLNLNNTIQTLYHYKEGIKEIPKCLCGKDRKYHCWSYRPTCGGKNCINIERENSKKEYCLENYGVEYVTQLNSMKEKSKKTLLDKYGVDNITKLPEVIKRRKERNLIKWGVEDPISLYIIRSKSLSDSERGLEKIQYGLPDGYKVIESDRFYYYIITCSNGHNFEIGKNSLYLKKKNNIEICNQCNTSIGSNGEQEVYEYISSIYKGDISRSNRKLISPYEIDIVLQDLKLCIEFNGDYWHSIKVNDDPDYHLNKTLRCMELGYDLLQIRENDWNLNKDEIKKKLFNRINNIYDSTDLNIDGDYLIFDMSWYDSRMLEDLKELHYEFIEPKLIDCGQYKQWNCGFKVFKIF
jgi:very-short-patch-repair endonuclease